MAGYLRDVTGGIPATAKTCQEWVRPHPNEYAAYVYLGLNYLLIGEYAKSALAFREGIRHRPERTAGYVDAMLAYVYSGTRSLRTTS